MRPSRAVHAMLPSCKADSLRGQHRAIRTRSCQGRDGAKTGWNYLLIANIGHATGHLEQVYEHKVMRDDVARYLVAMSQRLQTLTQNHEIRIQSARTRRGSAMWRDVWAT